MPALLTRVSTRPKRSRAARELFGRLRAGDVARDGYQVRLAAVADRARAADHRQPSRAVARTTPAPMPWEAPVMMATRRSVWLMTRDRVRLRLRRVAGCRVSGLVSTFIQASTGSEWGRRTAFVHGLPQAQCAPAPESLHSRIRWPCRASSAARSASSASVSATASAGVPGGTMMVNVVRNSGNASFAARAGHSGVARAA